MKLRLGCLQYIWDVQNSNLCRSALYYLMFAVEKIVLAFSKVNKNKVNWETEEPYFQYFNLSRKVMYMIFTLLFFSINYIKK
jgi:hypothetical protein